MKPIQKLFLVLTGVVLIAANAGATRWLTRDPMDIPQHMERDPLPSLDLNQYTFVRNDPVNVIDPFGLEGNPISGAGQSYSPDIYGGAGTFYSAGYLWNDRLVNMGKLEDLLDPPLYPNPTLPAPVNAVFWDPREGQWILQREGLQPDPVMETAVLMVAGGFASSPSSYRVCPAPKPNWIWGANKGFAKTIRQMEQRGWSPQQINEALDSGAAFPAKNLVNPGNAATGYINPSTGQVVVLDDVTQEVLHLGGPGFKY